MNFLAHTLVANRSGSASPEMALGAALPDLAGMAGVRFDDALLPDEVRRGMACHHRADASFHANGDFLSGSREIRRRAQEAGLSDGASRAVGHVGWELLLDGAVLGVPQASDGFEDAVRRAGGIGGALSGEDRETWSTLVESLGVSRWWLRYDDPGFIADRLYAMLRRRRRLAFPPRHVEVVAELLAASQGSVQAASGAVVQSVVDRLDEGRPATAAGARTGETHAVTVHTRDTAETARSFPGRRSDQQIA